MSGYNQLNRREVGQLIDLCQCASPEKLNGKCLFEKNDLDSGNEFYELSSVESTVALSNSVMVAGRSAKVSKVMAYKRTWRRNNYDEPIAQLMSNTSYSSGDEECVLL